MTGEQEHRCDQCYWLDRGAPGLHPQRCGRTLPTLTTAAARAPGGPCADGAHFLTRTAGWARIDNEAADSAID